MPEFKPATLHKVTATFINPKTAPFDYGVSLCMGVDGVEVSGASFRLSGGESRPVEFWVTMPVELGTYPVSFKVSSKGRLIGSFPVGDVTIELEPAPMFTMPPEMEAECECPYPDPVYWYCTFRVPITNCGNAPGTYTLKYWDSLGYLEPQFEEITLQPEETYLWERVQLVKFDLHPSPLIVYLQGDWEENNLSEGRCYKCAPYEWPAGRSKVVATVLNAWYAYEDEDGNLYDYPYEGTWYVGSFLRLRIDHSEGIPGFYNVGQDYIGQEIPFDIDTTDVLPDRGKQITCILICGGGNYNVVGWWVRNVRYLREYPDEAYEFSYVETANVPGFMISYDVNWTITGNVPEFAIVYYRCLEEAAGGPPWAAKRVTGPATIRVWKAYNEPYPSVAFAHPNPNQPWDLNTWELNNWVEVARR